MGLLRDTQGTLIYQLEPNEALDQDAYGMLRNNAIEHIVSLAYKQIDDRREIRFESAGLQTARAFFAQRALNRQQVVEVLMGVADAFADAEEYMLSPESFISSLDTTFIGAGSNVLLTYVPVAGFTSCSGARAFLRDIRRCMPVNAVTGDAAPLQAIDNALNGAGDFSVAEFKKLLASLTLKPKETGGSSAGAGHGFAPIDDAGAQLQGLGQGIGGFAPQGFQPSQSGGGLNLPNTGVGVAPFNTPGEGIASVPAATGADAVPPGGMPISGGGMAIPGVGMPAPGGDMAIPGGNGAPNMFGGMAIPGGGATPADVSAGGKKKKKGLFGKGKDEASANVGVSGGAATGRAAKKQAKAAQKAAEKAAKEAEKAAKKQAKGKGGKGGLFGRGKGGNPSAPAGPGAIYPGQQPFAIPGQEGVPDQAGGPMGGVQPGGIGAPGGGQPGGFGAPGGGQLGGQQAYDGAQGAYFNNFHQQAAASMGDQYSDDDFGVTEVHGIAPSPSPDAGVGMNSNPGGGASAGVSGYPDMEFAPTPTPAPAPTPMSATPPASPGPAVTAYLLRESTGEKRLIDKVPFRVGRRRSEVDFHIAERPKVSRLHAIVTSDGASFYIHDNKSSNHTMVNGRVINPNEDVRLADGDSIVMGDERFRFIVE